MKKPKATDVDAYNSIQREIAYLRTRNGALASEMRALFRFMETAPVDTAIQLKVHQARARHATLVSELDALLVQFQNTNAGLQGAEAPWARKGKRR